MKKLAFIPLVFLFACSNSSVESSEDEDNILVPEQVQEDKVADIESEIKTLPFQQLRLAEDGLNFQFDGFIVSIDSITLDFNSTSVIKAKNDTCYYDFELGEDLSNHKLRININEEAEYVCFNVFERNIFHFTISAEGPHCDLVELDPYHSKWFKLKENVPSINFQTLEWGEAKAPKLNMSKKELEALVLEHCGKDWVDLVGMYYDEFNPNNYLGISGYQLKIVATLKDGTEHVSVIQFSSPMGC